MSTVVTGLEVEKPVGNTPPAELWMVLEDGEIDTTRRPRKYPSKPDARSGFEHPLTPKSAQVRRVTAETTIDLSLVLGSAGKAQVQTGIGFFDHMLTLLAKHGLMDLSVTAKGDLHVDSHHTVEDVGICLGKALNEALGDRAGIRRYGHCVLPMDETLVTAAVDLGGRPYFVWKAEVPRGKLGDFESELAEDFWQAVATNALMNLHVVLHHGRNSHHIIEAIFKATARALRMAVEIDPRETGVPSTKGSLTV